jgi:hypothetical protein
VAIDELVARNVKVFHLEMMSDSNASVNLDDALFDIRACRGKLIITVIDKGSLEVREDPAPAPSRGRRA